MRIIGTRQAGSRLMARLGRLAGALVLLGWLVGGPAFAQTAPRPAAVAPAPFAKPLIRDDLASAAIRLEAALKAEAGTALRPAGQSRAAGQALLAAGKPDQALAPLAAAVAADPADIRNWQAYARAAAAAFETLDENDYKGRARLRGRAIAAAYRAYERAGAAIDAAASLALVGAAEAAQESWRRPTTPCGPSTASASSATRSMPTRPPRAPASPSRKPWCRRPITRPSWPSRERARPP
jgi:alpha-2-macroglobulin